MVAGLASLGIVAAEFCAAERHFLFRRLQCLWEWPAMAAGFASFGVDAADFCSPAMPPSVVVRSAISGSRLSGFWR